MGGSGDSLSLKVLLQAQNLGASTIKGFGSSIAALLNPATLAAAGFAALVGVLAKSVQMAAAYQQQMNMVQALTGASSQQMGYYDTQLKALAIDAGVAPTALAKGLYYVISAGYQGANAMKVLTLSTEDAKIGMTNQATTADALTNVLSAFAWQTKNATLVNGTMLETVTLGKSSFQAYASTISKAASVSSQYKINLQTMSAAWSTMTANTLTAGKASTDYQQLVGLMYGKVGTLTKSLAKNGIAFNENKFNAMSFGDKILYLNQLLGEAAKKHVQLTGVTLQAAQAITVIAGHFGVYKSDLATLSNKQEMANKTAQAWAITQAGFTQTMSRLGAAVQVVMVDIGQQLLPILTELANAVLPVVVALADWITKNNVVNKVLGALHTALQTVATIIRTTITVISDITGWFEKHRRAILSVATALLVFFLPALIKIGIQSALAGAKMAATLIAQIVQTGIQSTIAGAKMAISFIDNIIKAGIEGWQAAGKLAVFVGQLIASGVKAAWAGLQIAGKLIWSLIQSGLAAAKTAAIFVAKMIPALISMAVDGVGAAVAAIPGLIAGLVGATAAAWAFTVALLANPITWIVLAIVALIAIIILLATHWKQVTAWIGAALSQLGTWVHNFVSMVGGWFSALGSFFSMIWGKIVGFFKSHIAQIIAVVTGPFGALIVLIVTHWNQIKQFFVNLWNGVLGIFQSIRARISTAVTNAWNGLKSIITTWPKMALQWGLDFIMGLIHGITSGIGNLMSTVGGIAHNIASMLHFSKPDIGPLANFDTWMPDMMDLMTKGIIAGNPKLQAAVNMTAHTVAGVGSPPARAGSIPYGRPPIGGSAAGRGGDVHYHTHGPVTVNAKSANAKEVYKEFKEEMSKDFRRSGVFGTTSMGIRNS